MMNDTLLGQHCFFDCISSRNTIVRLRSHRSIRYTVFSIRFALRHRRDSAPYTLHHLNVVCGTIDLWWHRANRIAYSEYRIAYFYVITALWREGFSSLIWLCNLLLHQSITVMLSVFWNKKVISIQKLSFQFLECHPHLTIVT